MTFFFLEKIYKKIDDFLRIHCHPIIHKGRENKQSIRLSLDISYIYDHFEKKSKILILTLEYEIFFRENANY